MLKHLTIVAQRKLGVCLCAAVVLAGCGTTGSTRVDSSGGRTLTTVGEINMQDWLIAADTMVNSLRDNFINAGKLQTPPNKPALLAISRIVNDTGRHIDSDLLVKKIRIALHQASGGKIVTSTTVGIGGPEDPIAEEEQRRARLEGLDPSRPNYTLSGKIIPQRARAGRTQEFSFVFQLSLTKNPEGFAVWEDERAITKQAKKGAITPW